MHDTFQVPLAVPGLASNPASITFPDDPRWLDPTVECLIVTSDALRAEFEPLAAQKTSRGVFTEVITTSEILANATFTSSGPDLAAWIRNAIKHFHAHHGTEFVILGGDVNIIPTRYIYLPEGGEAAFGTYNGMNMNEFKPTDHYYAGLDGSWDEDGDGRFGEMNRDNDNNVDEVDWVAEVYVGRLPVNTVDQARVVVEKIIGYDRAPPAGDWLERAVFAGAVSQFASELMGTPAVDEAELSEFIIDHYFTNHEVDRLYQTSTSYTPPSPYTLLTKPNLIAAWNQGAALLNMAGHGDPASFGGYTTPSAFTWYLTRDDVASINNANKLPLVYIFSCSSGAFDVKEAGSPPASLGDSLSEMLLLRNNSGAIAVVSAARTSYYFPTDKAFEALNRGQNRFFWREFMMNREYQPGRALFLSLQSYIEMFINKYWNVDLNWDEDLATRENYLAYQYYLRKNILTYNLLGDPEMRIRTAMPKAFAATSFPARMHAGDRLVVEARADDGTLVAGARVLVNGSGYYITTTTDRNGRACIDIPVNVSLAGTNMTVTLAGHNMVQASKTMTLLEDTSPPANLAVRIDETSITINEPLRFTATGTDEGSGIVRAFAAFLHENGSIAFTRELRLTSVNGNRTTFRFQEQVPLYRGVTLEFLVIGFDASGAWILGANEHGSTFTVLVTPRVLETTLLLVAGIGIPVAATAIVSWLVVSRRRHPPAPGSY